MYRPLNIIEDVGAIYCWRRDRDPIGAESGTLMVKECASDEQTGTVRLPGTS